MQKIRILCFISGLLCFSAEISAQTDMANSKETDVLVYILPDSLELAPELKLGASVQQSVIRSQRLKTSLESLKTVSIAKEFPDWQEADSIAYNEFGEKVKKPEFHRVFTLSFATEQEADEAITQLNGLSAVTLRKDIFLPLTERLWKNSKK